ncbi:MAG: hypothetical protein GTO41_01840 [Burkholderiales bacterium]|nr:hypothetical protein [Burkholderiales bacterium]
MRVTLLLFAGLVAFAYTGAHAGEVEVVAVTFDKQGGTWRVDTTLRHADSGWDHYADAWRVVTADGGVLGTRTLYHPHVDEQPFTRSLSRIAIPDDTIVVFVEAHDKVHGWSRQRVRVDLTRSMGERYRVNRSP